MSEGCVKGEIGCGPCGISCDGVLQWVCECEE